MVKKKFLALVAAALLLLPTVAMAAEPAVEETSAVNITTEPGTPTGLGTVVVEDVLPEPLKEYAAVFCEEEKEHGVNLLFVAAIARQETASGTAGTAKSRNNLFGNRGEGGYMRFDSFEESIRYEFDVLERLYIGQGRDTVSSISKKYCVPPGPWAEAVSSFLEEYAGEAEELVNGE